MNSPINLQISPIYYNFTIYHISIACFLDGLEVGIFVDSNILWKP